MNINDAMDYFNKRGYRLKRIDMYYSNNLSVLHQNACKERLNVSLSLHDFYCDMKRFESLEIGGICVGLYNQLAGFPTEIYVKPDCISHALTLIINNYVDLNNILIFERTGTDPNPYPVPTGKVYSLVKI